MDQSSLTKEDLEQIASLMRLTEDHDEATLAYEQSQKDVTKAASVIYYNKLISARFVNHMREVIVADRANVIRIFYVARGLQLLKADDDDIYEFRKLVREIADKDLAAVNRLAEGAASWGEALREHLKNMLTIDEKTRMLDVT